MGTDRDIKTIGKGGKQLSHQKLTASNYCPKRNEMHRKVIILWTTQWTFSLHTSLILGERGGKFSRRKIAFLALNSCQAAYWSQWSPFFRAHTLNNSKAMMSYADDWNCTFQAPQDGARWISSPPGSVTEATNIRHKRNFLNIVRHVYFHYCCEFWLVTKGVYCWLQTRVYLMTQVSTLDTKSQSIIHWQIYLFFVNIFCQVFLLEQQG